MAVMIMFPSVALAFAQQTQVALAQQVRTPACQGEGKEAVSTTFGIQKSVNKPITNNQALLYNGSDAGPGHAMTASYYRFRIVQQPGTAASGWTLTIRDEAQRIQQILQPADFAAATAHGVWTRFLKAQKVTSNIDAEAGVTASLRAEEVIILPEGASEIRYSWSGPTAKYISLYSYNGADTERVRKSGDRVGFLVGWDEIEVAGTTRGANWCCSGVLLTEDLLLTNWHCGGLTSNRPEEIWRDSAVTGRTCDQVMVNMAWDDGSTRREAGCKKVEERSDELDYAVVRLKPIAGGSVVLAPRQRMEIAASRPALGASLRIVHHAECKPKLVSFGCAVSEPSRAAWKGARSDTEFAHNCDTEGGASGAPVFDANGKLVGLHHFGFQRMSNGSCDKKNKAVHIDAILADIKEKNAPLHGEIMAGVSSP